MQAEHEARNAPVVHAPVVTAPIVLARFPEAADEAWQRLTRDVVGGGSAESPLIAALDRAVDALLDGVDVDAALAATDAPGAPAAAPDPETGREGSLAASAPLARQPSALGAAR